MADHEQLIDRDRVYCRVRQEDVDIEQCLSCGDLRYLRTDGRHPTLVCRADRVREDPALI